MPVVDYENQPISGVNGRPALKPGKSLKFAVEDPATLNRSSTWLVKTGRHLDDVYVCEVSSGGEWKTSLHNEGGVWRIAMTADAANRRGIPRVVLSEQMGKRAEADGWAEGTALLIPCSDLRHSPVQLQQSVIRVPTSPRHSAIGVRLLLQEFDSTTFTQLDDAFGLGVFERSNGGTLYVAAQLASLKSELIQSLTSLRNDARSMVPDGERFVGIFGRDDQRILVDLAL